MAYDNKSAFILYGVAAIGAYFLLRNQSTAGGTTNTTSIAYYPQSGTMVVNGETFTSMTDVVIDGQQYLASDIIGITNAVAYLLSTPGHHSVEIGIPGGGSRIFYVDIP